MFSIYASVISDACVSYCHLHFLFMVLLCDLVCVYVFAGGGFVSMVMVKLGSALYIYICNAPANPKYSVAN